jgi:hypothetical protein
MATTLCQGSDSESMLSKNMVCRPISDMNIHIHLLANAYIPTHTTLIIDIAQC